MDKIEKIKAGFAYLDDLEEADLIWEFIRRSSEYQKACEAYIADRAYCSQTIDDPELGMIYIFQIKFLSVIILKNLKLLISRKIY